MRLGAPRTFLEKLHHHLADPTGLASKHKNTCHVGRLEVTHDDTFGFSLYIAQVSAFARLWHRMMKQSVLLS
jgi:hypothetical protein